VTEIFHDWTDRHFVQPFPLEKSSIMVKTLPWDATRDPIREFSDLETMMFLTESSEAEGFC